MKGKNDSIHLHLHLFLLIASVLENSIGLQEAMCEQWKSKTIEITAKYHSSILIPLFQDKCIQLLLITHQM